MKLKDIYNSEKSRPVISFEVFPPKDNDLEALDKELNLLKKYNPALISVTSTSAATNVVQNEIVKNIRNKMQLTIMPHLTCVRNCRSDVDEYIKILEKSNVDCILALRGDFPADNAPVCTDFKYANELIEFIKAKSDLSIGVAGYPEGHIEADNIQDDINNLKRKLSAGGEVIYTQLFFDNDKFFRYLELLENNGIDVPVAAGIMPVISYSQITRMIKLAKISVPKSLEEKIERYKDDKNSLLEFGVEFAVNQCRDLIETGVCGLHFYTLNKAYSTSKILDNITK